LIFRENRMRVLIVDPHVLVAEGLKHLLEPEFRVVSIEPDGSALVESLEKLRPDVVILDFSMPNLSPVDAGQKIKSTRGAAKLIFLATSCCASVAAEALRCGASGYVLKRDGIDEIRCAVRSAVRGESYVSPLVDRYEVELQRRSNFRNRRNSQTLTFREREILQLLIEGKSAKQIGCVTHIKPGTVSFHKYSMMRRLGIRTGAGLLEYAIRQGLSSTRP
jgi:DNA-binding NarL/FixJ family response regulator